MKPILFNTEMVQAILEGRKTVTRRVLKLPSYIEQNENGLYTLFADGDCCYENQSMEEVKDYIKPPYAAGDILYVRETWHVCKGKYIYRAGFNKGLDALPLVKWKPSIHMPKAAARIFLKVTNVRVERLQDITEEQAKAEGSNVGISWTEKLEHSSIERFEMIWNSTLKKDQISNYGWEANPYVWVIEFEQISKEEAEHGETN